MEEIKQKDIRNADEVHVEVMGKHDVFFVKIPKKEAIRLAQEADKGQFCAFFDGGVLKIMGEM